MERLSNMTSWIVYLILDIVFQIYIISFSDKDQLKFFISLRSQIFNFMNQDDELIDPYLMNSIFINLLKLINLF